MLLVTVVSGCWFIEMTGATKFYLVCRRRHKHDCLCAICVLKRRRREREENARIAKGSFCGDKLAKELRQEVWHRFIAYISAV